MKEGLGVDSPKPSFFVLCGAIFAWGIEFRKGCGPCPQSQGTGGATAPNRATKAILVILEMRSFTMTPVETLQSSALAGTLTPEALFLSGFDLETVYLKNVRTAGV